MIGQGTTRESQSPGNRMEPSGPNRYLITDLQMDRKIVSSLIVDSVLSVLRSEYDFDEKEIDHFHSKLQKEIGSK